MPVSNADSVSITGTLFAVTQSGGEAVITVSGDISGLGVQTPTLTATKGGTDVTANLSIEIKQGVGAPVVTIPANTATAVSEGAAAGTVLVSPTATNPNPDNSQHIWSLVNPPAGVAINPTTGVVTISDAVAWAAQAGQSIMIQVRADNEVGIPQSAGVASIVIINVVAQAAEPLLLPAVPESDPPNPGPDGNGLVAILLDEGVTPSGLLDFNATDADGGSVFYSLIGDDAQHWTIDGFGVLSPDIAFDYDNPVDAGANNLHEFSVVITAQRNAAEQKVVPVEVTINEVVAPPQLLGPTPDGDGVIRVTLVDGASGEVADLDVLNSTYAITGGQPDGSLFTIDGFGKISKAVAFDHASPTDSDTDNVYDVEVTATSQADPASVLVQHVQFIVQAAGGAGVELQAFQSYAMDGPEWARLKGLGIAHLNNLYNWTLKRNGSNDRIVSYQFRADRTGTIAGLYLYWIAAASSGYSNGDGGVVDIRVLPDDGTANHYPNTGASTLAQTTFTPNLVEPNGTAPGGFGIGPYIPLSWAVTKGTLYHIVFRNIGPTPATDYIALDAYSGKSAQPDIVPFLGPFDWRVLRQDTPPGQYQATWKDQTNQLIDTSNYTSPIMAIDYGSGKAQGIILMESGNVIVSGGTDRLFVATATNPVRTRIQPDVNWELQKWFLWAAFKVGGDFQVTLQDSGLSTIEQWTLSRAADYVVSGTSMIYNLYEHLFSAPRTLTSGQTYYLEYRPIGSCQVGMAAVRDYRHGNFPNVVQDCNLFRSERFHSGGWHATNFYSHNATGQTEREAFLDCVSLT